MPKLNALVAGSTGYIGVQLIKILVKHKYINIKYLCGNSSVGKNISSYNKSLSGKKLPKIIKFNKKLLKDVDVVFTGQKHLNLADNIVGSDVQSIFQIAAVTRPLMSVGRICDKGHNITFDNICAVVRDKEGQELCQFHRGPSGGLYAAKLKLKSPAGFGRLE